MSIVSTTLEDRFILVLRLAENAYGTWQGLEDRTGITSARWRKAFGGMQRPTPDMVQALCRLTPEYAFWIATGITDAENGHKAPASALPFPEWRGSRTSDEAAVSYFKVSLGLLEVLAAQSRVNGESSEDRLEAFGLRRMSGRWWASPIAAEAQEIAGRTVAYKELKRLRNDREAFRTQHLAKKTKPSRMPHATDHFSSERVDPLTEHLDDSDLFWS